MLGLGGGGGGRIRKGSGLCIYALLVFCASPFCDVQWLAGSPFYEAVILYSLLFQNLDPFFAYHVSCLLCVLRCFSFKLNN